MSGCAREGGKASIDDGGVAKVSQTHTNARGERARTKRERVAKRIQLRAAQYRDFFAVCVVSG